MTRRLAPLLLAALLAAGHARAQPATQPADATPSTSRSLDLVGPTTTLDDLERAIDRALTPDGQPADLDNLDPLHRAAAAASRIAASPAPPADRQRAAELEALTYNALANAAQQRDRPTETGLRLMQARTAAESLNRQGPEPARQAGAWWKLNADLADASRLDRNRYPTPRAHRDAVAALESYLDLTGVSRFAAPPTPPTDPPAIDTTRQRAARLMLFQLYRDAGNADGAQRLANDLLNDDGLSPEARNAVLEARPWLDAPGRRVRIPDDWPAGSPTDNPALDGPPPARAAAWVIETDPALPLTRATARALASGDYPALDLHTVYLGDATTPPAPLDDTHALHRLTADPAHRQALADLAIDRVPAVVVLNGSSRLVASGHTPAALDRLLLAP
ncbi:MAG: hypothetical protein AAF842_08825 [Planctomycetota bacterium]